MYCQIAWGLDKGIYVSQDSLENTKYINYLIDRSKKVGISTFIVDLNLMTPRYEKNIHLVLDSGIKYIARIVIFPGGGTDDQILSEAYWEKRYKLVQTAIQSGAQGIQLDYIRYNTKRPASAQNARNVYQVISWFKNRLNESQVPLQIDVFGISSFGEEKHIGQNVQLFANSVDVICPMDYPSHFEPFRQHAVTPYKTVYDALIAFKQQFNGPVPVKLYPYIELSNYRYPLSREQRFAYINAQIRAVENAGADGWYAWSPGNKYDYLFTVLENRSQFQAKEEDEMKLFENDQQPTKLAEK
jgi:hypothetical protein